MDRKRTSDQYRSATRKVSNTSEYTESCDQFPSKYNKPPVSSHEIHPESYHGTVHHHHKGGDFNKQPQTNRIAPDNKKAQRDDKEEVNRPKRKHEDCLVTQNGSHHRRSVSTVTAMDTSTLSETSKNKNVGSVDWHYRANGHGSGHKPPRVSSSPSEKTMNRGGRVWHEHHVEKTSIEQARGRRSPPTNFWPQRSPPTRTANHNNTAGNDESSFTLFTNSFDMLSETGNYLRDLNQQENYGFMPSPSGGGHNTTNNHPISSIDVPLSQLNHESSDCSLGDISPIKVVHSRSHGEGEDQQHPMVQTNNFSRYSPSPPSHISRRSNGFGSGGNNKHEKQMANNVSASTTDTPMPDSGGDFHCHWRQDGPSRHNSEYPNNYQVSNPFFVLRSFQEAFDNCTYTLPSCRRADAEMPPIHHSSYGHSRHYMGRERFGLEDPARDLLIAKRRVETSVCTFGGNMKPRQHSDQMSSIFRLKGRNNKNNKAYKQRYEQRLPERYNLSVDRISWDFEEDPSIVTSSDTEGENSVKQGYPQNVFDEASRQGICKFVSGPNCPSPTTSKSFGPGPDVTKMKYRCKLCGQLKQNHICPFRNALQRDIGVMVYPAVNSYTASEPGFLAQALSQMNNFVPYEPGQSGPDGGSQRQNHSYHPNAVTPDSLREGGIIHLKKSPSSLTASPIESNLDVSADDHHQQQRRGGGFPNKNTNGSRDRKRSHSLLSPDNYKSDTSTINAPFVPSITLRTAQYRAVSSDVIDGRPAPYQYPNVPLTYSERKRLSDTLFCLSRGVPGMTSECAVALREARQQDDWDLAVAELLTQLIVGLYCGEGDYRLDGLQQYLLELGVSC